MAYLIFESSKGRKDLVFITLSQEQAFSCCELWSEQAAPFIYRVYEVKEGVESLNYYSVFVKKGLGEQ